MFLETQMLTRSAKAHLLKHEEFSSNHISKRHFDFCLQFPGTYSSLWLVATSGQITKVLLATIIPQCKVLQRKK